MYLVTIVNWGLNDLAVREAAINPQQSPKIFGVSLSMRWLIAAVITPLTLLGLWLLRDIMPPLSWGTQLALVLLLIHLWPAGAAGRRVRRSRPLNGWKSPLWLWLSRV